MTQEPTGSNRHVESGSFHDDLARIRQDQDRLFAQLRDGQVHFRRLARSVWRVQEDERRRIARDLHDGVGQSLGALRQRLDGLRSYPPDSGKGGPQGNGHRSGLATSDDEIDTAINICDAALEEVRRLARALRPQILDDLGLAAALRWLARSQSAATSVEVDVERLDATLPLELATVAFRVAQEGLANAVRHGQARNVVLRAFVRADCLHLWVVDDGNGFDAVEQQVASRRGEGSGLSGMRERVELMGGTFGLQTQPGEGVQIRVMLPIAEDSPR